MEETGCSHQKIIHFGYVILHYRSVKVDLFICWFRSVKEISHILVPPIVFVFVYSSTTLGMVLLILHQHIYALLLYLLMFVGLGAEEEISVIILRINEKTKGVN